MNLRLRSNGPGSNMFDFAIEPACLYFANEQDPRKNESKARGEISNAER